MEKLVEKGYIRSIGVSNFGVQMLWDLFSYCKYKPVVNEIEIHPLFTNNHLIKYCKDNNVMPISYCPIARGANSKKNSNILENKLIKQLGAKYGKSPA